MNIRQILIVPLSAKFDITGDKLELLYYSSRKPRALGESNTMTTDLKIPIRFLSGPKPLLPAHHRGGHCGRGRDR